MRIYNTLTRQTEEIIPIEPGKIRLYSCGPTVYRNIHIGNLRTFTMTDWLRRVLEYHGYDVLHVKNITDVGHMRQERLDRGEDKVIAQARKEGKTSAQIAEFYTEAFHNDETALNILPAHIFPRATDHIPEMIALVQDLLARDIAYHGGENIYFDIQRFSAYGQLSGNLLEQMLAGVREGSNEEKRHPEDFPLWKKAEPGREMAWDSPWGRGFPGWHIECSAMSLKYLGKHFDLHTGGVDNIFPHHEDELAQTEASTGQRMVNCWVHAQHLLADGQKMAKSTGNAYTRADIEARGYDAMALRYFYTTAKYRSRLNFTFRALRAAEVALQRLRDRAYQLLLAAERKVLLETSPGEIADPNSFRPELVMAKRWRLAFLAAVNDDLNMPRAMALVWKLLRDGEIDATTRLRLLLDADRILGFGLRTYLLSEEPARRLDPQTYLAAVPDKIASQVIARQQARQQQQYELADHYRVSLAAAGYKLRDTPRGTLVLRKTLEDDVTMISRPTDISDGTKQDDEHLFSIILLAHQNQHDLERCLRSLGAFDSSQPQYIRAHDNLEIIIVENGSTDGTQDYVHKLATQIVLPYANKSKYIPVRVLLADHNLGQAGGINAALRASRGRYVVVMDTSIELRDEIWPKLTELLDNPEIGLIGPYGLVTDDLREFREAPGPDVDAIEGYLLAFRRSLVPEIGWLDEHFRFYRLLDIYLSFFVKAAGYRVVAIPELAASLIQHPHLEWESLNDEERTVKSKKNFDLFYTRWHHGQSLLVANYKPGNRWFGHDHPRHVEGDHTHTPTELPPPGVAHSHKHQHWADHDHDHPHCHQ